MGYVGVDLRKVLQLCFAPLQILFRDSFFYADCLRISLLMNNTF